MNSVDFFKVTKTNRDLLLKIIENHSLDQLNEVPEGFNNNIIWNIAHVITTQQLLIYGLSNNPLIISDSWVNLYKKGTKPEKQLSQNEVNEVKEMLHLSLVKLEEDYQKNIFKDFREYETSTGFVIRSLEDAIFFNNYHEGIHFGYILALRKYIKK